MTDAPETKIVDSYRIACDGGEGALGRGGGALARALAAAERYEVDATGQRKLNEADNVLSEEARSGRLRGKILEHMEGIIRESVRPMAMRRCAAFRRSSRTNWLTMCSRFNAAFGICLMALSSK